MSKNIGSKNGNWNNGICFERGYKLIRVYNHPFATKRGYIREHRLIMEQYLKRYLLPNEDVHHINGIKSDNRIENLQLVTHSEHKKIHNSKRVYKRKDYSNYFCLICNSNKTYIDNKNYPHWNKYKDGYICNKCYNYKDKPRKLKKTPKPKIIKIPKICLNCKSDKTYMRNNGKYPIWYKYKDGYLCVKCNGYKRNKKKIILS